MSDSRTGRYPLIDLLKVILTVGIVLRHSTLVGLMGRNASFDLFSRIMETLTEVCVPAFFVLSGFLYFRNVPARADASFFWNKTRKRVMTLLVPYLIANAVAFGFYGLAHRYMPGMISGYFGDEWRKPLFIFWTGPVNMSLWFIRDLIIACIVAPLIYLLVRYTRIWGVLVLAGIWFFLYSSPWFNLWFIVGAWAAVCQGEAAGRLLGRSQCKVPADAAAWCFFIYLYHYIPVISFKKLLGSALEPHSFFALTGTYLATALLTLALVTGVYILLKKTAPRLTGVLVGGKI